MEWLKNNWEKLAVGVCLLFWLSGKAYDFVNKEEVPMAVAQPIDWQYIAEQQEVKITALEAANAELEKAIVSLATPQQKTPKRATLTDSLIWKYQKKYGSSR